MYYFMRECLAQIQKKVKISFDEKKKNADSALFHHMCNYLNFLFRAASDFFLRLTLGFS